MVELREGEALEKALKRFRQQYNGKIENYISHSFYKSRSQKRRVKDMMAEKKRTGRLHNTTKK